MLPGRRLGRGSCEFSGTDSARGTCVLHVMHRTVAPKVEKCQVSTESVTTISGSAVVATRAEREREADPDASRPVLMLVLVAPTQFQISPTLPCQAEEARVHGVLAIKMARGSGSEVKLRRYHGLSRQCKVRCFCKTRGILRSILQETTLFFLLRSQISAQVVGADLLPCSCYSSLCVNFCIVLESSR